MSPSVLVVDDSASVRREVARALADFDIREACDGVEGVQQINAENHSGLVICDVNMPRMSGIQMLENVQEAIQSGQIDVVMLTTEGQPKLIRRARELGAKGWLVKPFNPAQLLAVARKLTATTV